MGALIHTDLENQSLEGYLAEGTIGAPGVIVIQEWWGLVGHIKSIVDRLAEEGFTALAPDLYHGQAASEPNTAKKLMMELELDSAAKEIEAAAKFLKSQGAAKIGVIGFCMGGTLSIWGASWVPEINASVAFYPGSSWERHNPKWESFKGKEVIIHCAEGDGTSAAPGIQEALTKIRSAGGSAIAYDYPNTQHAFFNDERPEVYNPSAAELAWDRTLEFLRKNL